VTLTEAAAEALRHFVHLDEANAAIHTAPVRYSPITFRLAEALRAESFLANDDYVRRVMTHIGQYEEDKGR
jgi:hypothetical protein